MAHVGKYEVLDELYLTAQGSVSRARRADGERGLFAVKRLTPPDLEPGEPHWELQTFLDRARAQQQVVAAGAKNWATIHDLGMEGDGAYFVADYFPLSAQKLIDGHVPLKADALFALVRAIVQGLTELKAARGRAHGNLKPTNVLIAGRDLTNARVLLTDLASNAQAARAGEPGDLHALGEMIYALVQHRPAAKVHWPLADEGEWPRLGRRADGWRRLCNELLNPIPGDRPTLLAVAKRLHTLRPRRRVPVRKIARAVLVPVIVIGAALAAFSFSDHVARKRFCTAKHEWFGAFAQAIADHRDMRERWQADPDLKRLLSEVPVNEVRRVDCDARRLVRYNLADYLRLRRANKAVAAAQSELSGRWVKAARADDLRRHFRDRGWYQPDFYLTQLINGTHPAPGADVAGAIDRLLRASPNIESGLSMTERNWKQFSQKLRQIQAAHDPTLTALANMLKKNAAADLRLGDEGFSGIDRLDADIAQVDRLAETLQTTWPTNVDRERFDRDVAAAIDPKNVKREDVVRWLQIVTANAYRRSEAQATAAELRKRLNETADLVTHAHLGPDEVNDFDAGRRGATSAIAEFEQAPFTQRSLDDGTFERRRDEVSNRINALRKFYHPDTPEDWLKTLPAIATTSQRVNAFWEVWRRVLRESLPDMTRDRDAFTANQQATEQLRALLVSLDEGFAPAPSLPLPAFTAAAKQRREQAIEKLLPQIEPRAPKLDHDMLRATQQAYAQWAADLVALSRDFPITRELLTPDDRPDGRWREAKGDFWNDPLVQGLVKDDVARINRLAALASAPRDELVKQTASPATEVALAAWRLLGGQNMRPSWPTQADELVAEFKMRQHLAAALKALKDPKDADAPTADLLEQGPARWQRYVQAATTGEMLQSAWNLREPFGVDARQIASLAPPVRFDLYLAALRQAMSAGDDDATRDTVAGLTVAANDLKGRPPMALLATRLSRLGAKEPFADEKPGDAFRLTLPGTKQPIEFRRIEPASTRPFYLCTTEVSVAQFAAVLEGTNLWAQARDLPWPYAPGKPDPRHGPRTWEWGDQPGNPMTTPPLWLAPDMANDYPLLFRAGRFNRTSLSDEVGGNPSADHPMQYISAQAALLYAAACGCRLPSSSEWQATYSAYEKAIPAARWNLRDQAWDAQRRYVITTEGNRFPDEGAFPAPGLSASSVGATASSRPGNDGTLFFRPISAADAKVFAHLVGNVAEFTCDAAEAFDALSDKRSAATIRAFAGGAGGRAMFVIGGSALSAPEVPIDKPLPVTRTDEGYADVGLRLAFTAPARSLTERVRWALGEQGYLFAEKSK